MLIPNPDLLHNLARHHPDGRPLDPHAHHRAEHLALLRAHRRARWTARFRHLLKSLAAPKAPRARSEPCLSCKH